MNESISALKNDPMQEPERKYSAKNEKVNCFQNYNFK